MNSNYNKKHLGKFKDRVRIDAWIMAAQDEELVRLSFAMGKKKTDCILEAVADFINKYRAKGV
jgi:hypothetical protein